MASVFPVPGYVSDNRRSLVRIDGYLILSTVLLIVVGLMSLYSQSQTVGIVAPWFKKQLVNVGIGLVPFALFAWVHPKFWRRIASGLYAVTISLLLLVFVHGKHTKGAGRWIPIGSVQFQPSELAKILTVITLAAFYTARQDRIDRPSTMFLGLAHALVPTTLILLQPHLGASLVMLVMWFAVSLVAGIPLKNLGALCAGILAFFTIVIAVPQIRTHIVHDYQWVRILELIEGKKDKIDKKGDNYQANQAEIAFADGGLSGSGFLRGEQKGYVPEQQNDFIFTVIGEEGGLIGCTLVLLSYAFFFYRIWLTMVQSVDPNTKMIAGGIFAILGFHTFVNIAMVLQMLPVVGLWLPFLSYGGTAMWLCMACVGLMVGVQRREKPILF